MTVKPSAQGSLAKTPFAHLLLYTHGRQLSGTLAVWPDSNADKSAGQDRVLFHEGSVVAMRPMVPAASIYAGLLPLFRRQDAAYGFYEGHNLLGSGPGVLNERADTYTLLARGLRESVREEVMDPVLARLNGRSVRIRAGVPLERLEFTPKELAFIDTLRAAPATPEDLLASSELSALNSKRVLYLLTLIRGVEAVESSDQLPRVTLDSFSPKRALDTPSRSAVGERPGSSSSLPRVTVGDRSPSSSSMPRTTLGDRPASRDSSANRAPVSATPTAPGHSSGHPSVSMPPVQLSAPPAPASLSPQDSARWTEIALAHDRLDDQNHFELLNVAQTASAQDVNAAYYVLVKKFHPDRLPPALASLTLFAQVLFERITEANETLSNPDTRAEYVKTVAAGGGTRASERMMRNVLESALEFQKAEVLTKRRDFAQAMQLIRSALAKNPGEADYHALYAWLLHLTNPTDPAPTDEMLRELDRALKANPRNERAHYYKGVVLKRLNRQAEATRHFRTAVDINPRNVDAAREVRLAMMRRDSARPGATSNAPGGILSRLFGTTKGDD